MWVQNCPKCYRRTCKSNPKRTAKYRKSDSWRSKRKCETVKWTRDKSENQRNETCDKCESSKYQKNEQTVKQNVYEHGQCELECGWKRTLVYDLKCNNRGPLCSDINDIDDSYISKNWKWFYHHDTADNVTCYDKLTNSPSRYQISLHIFKYLMHFKIPVHLCSFTLVY